MVAENPPPDGNDRGLSLPLEPPNNDGHALAHKPIFLEECENLCQATAQSALTLNDILQDFRVDLQNR